MRQDHKRARNYTVPSARVEPRQYVRRLVDSLLTYYQIISPGCFNLDKLDGTAICVSPPGIQYVAPSVTSLAASVVTTPVARPTDIAEGTKDWCGRYYKAVPGDYCNMILVKFGISLEDFTFLNSAINVK
jgi:hypothetical protein